MPQVSHIASHLLNPSTLADSLLDLQAGQVFNLKLAIGFGTADATVLATLPTGILGPKSGAGPLRYRLVSAHWEITTSWTGGASSAIGLSSANALYNTKGNLLGGASGDVAAGLVSTTPFAGTAGAKFGANGGNIVLSAADTILFNQITSTFTAGAGFAHLNFQLVG